MKKTGWNPNRSFSFICDVIFELASSTFDIRAVGGVYLDLVSCIDEQWYADSRTGFNGGGFQGVGRRVAFQSGFGVGNFQYHLCGNIGEQNSVRIRMYGNIAGFTVFKEIDTVYNLLGY